MAKAYDYVKHNQELMAEFNSEITSNNILIHEGLNNPDGLNDLDLISLNMCGVLFENLNQRFIKHKDAGQTIVNLLNNRN